MPALAPSRRGTLLSAGKNYSSFEGLVCNISIKKLLPPHGMAPALDFVIIMPDWTGARWSSPSQLLLAHTHTHTHTASTTPTPPQQTTLPHRQFHPFFSSDFLGHLPLSVSPFPHLCLHGLKITCEFQSGNITHCMETQKYYTLLHAVLDFNKCASRDNLKTNGIALVRILN